MANKFLDQNGLSHLWQAILNKFVVKVDGKGLSSNDYTADEKAKLAGIDTGATKTIISDSLATDSATEALSARQGKVLDEKISANKTTVTDNLTSTSATEALSANQGKILNDRITAINTNMGNLGGGDMMKSAYDTNDNGKVDNADNADNADKLGGALPSAYVKQTEIKTVAKTGSYNDLTDKPTDFAPSSHTHEQSEVNGLENTISTVTAIANGKCHSEVFDTVDDMNTWIANAENTKNLKVGDVFLIRAVNVPDYWWDGSSAQILETTKVELDVISNEEIDTIVASS